MRQLTAAMCGAVSVSATLWRRVAQSRGVQAGLLLGLAAGAARAGDFPQIALLPSETEARHLGVRECAGAPCHGAQQPQPGRVAQDEHTRWFREDRHARAYRTLLSERSREIARNLSLENPPHQDAQCLGCHADDPRSRGPELRSEDGVGCEACHGGSERWLKTHTGPRRKHVENVADGLYPMAYTRSTTPCARPSSA
jgi:hypothetical protein